MEFESLSQGQHVGWGACDPDEDKRRTSPLSSITFNAKVALMVKQGDLPVHLVLLGTEHRALCTE